MLESKRWTAVAFALLSLLCLRLPSLSAQAPEQAHPLYIIQSSGHTSFQGYTPAQIRHGYGFDQVTGQGKGQTIAIVNAFDDPSIEQDLAVFTSTFGLPPCTSNNGCFQKVYATGSNPGTNAVWAFETAIDVEWAHAIAPQAKILLVEAPADTLNDLLSAVQFALSPQFGANTVTMSWGTSEFPTESSFDGIFIGSKATFFAASGDLGHGVLYPSASPYVVSIGGTTLHLNAQGDYQGETAWSGSGGGLSAFEPALLYQTTYPIPNNPLKLRGTPDVSYVGDPNTGIAVYDSIPMGKAAGWFEVGGTSAGTPQWAALTAIVNSMRKNSALPSLPGALYDASLEQRSNYHDVTKNNDGNCGIICKAQPGYDYVTGLGTPQADKLIPFLKDLP